MKQVRNAEKIFQEFARYCSINIFFANKVFEDPGRIY